MQRWEYRTEKLNGKIGQWPSDSLARLNALGAEGWEAVGMSYSWLTHTHHVLLKREVGF